MKVLDSEKLVRLLDVEARRRKVLTNNLANLDTPGYRAGRVNFTRSLQKYLSSEDPGEDIGTEVVHPHFDDADASGNDVTLGREVVALNENTMRTETFLEFLKFRKRLTRAAIEGR